MIIGVTGFIGSGKDTIADYLVATQGFTRVSFASALKDTAASIFGWDRQMLEGATKESRQWREEKDEWWTNRLGMEITPRWVLQYLGTDVFRNRFHPDIWVASVENTIRRSNGNIVITDCRFSNEVHAIKRAGGLAIRVSRDRPPVWYGAAVNYNKGPNNNDTWFDSKKMLEEHNVHASEYSSVGLDYDHYIENNTTLDDLYERVNLLLNHHVSK